MNFGHAIEALKDDKMIRRAGWNGKGMHVYLEEHSKAVIGGGVFRGTERKYEAMMVLFTTQGTHQPGWNASTADVLAEDWEAAHDFSQHKGSSCSDQTGTQTSQAT